MTCCSDPDSVAPVDDADRTIWLRAGDHSGWHQSSPVGWASVRAGGDCDGLDFYTPPTVWWYRRVGDVEWTFSKEYPNPTDPGSWEVVASTSARVAPLAFADYSSSVVRFDNTPDPRTIAPEKIAAARKTIDAIRARRMGLGGIDWPAGWLPSALNPGYRIGPHGAARLPDTERGRRAAWELEGG